MHPLDIHSEKVAVLLGGQSGEREVSLMSGNGVLQALQSLGVNAQAFDPSVQSSPSQCMCCGDIDGIKIGVTSPW